MFAERESEEVNGKFTPASVLAVLLFSRLAEDLGALAGILPILESAPRLIRGAVFVAWCACSRRKARGTCPPAIQDDFLNSYGARAA